MLIVPDESTDSDVELIEETPLESSKLSTPAMDASGSGFSDAMARQDADRFANNYRISHYQLNESLEHAHRVVRREIQKTAAGKAVAELEAKRDRIGKSLPKWRKAQELEREKLDALGKSRELVEKEIELLQGHRDALRKEFDDMEKKLRADIDALEAGPSGNEPAPKKPKTEAQLAKARRVRLRKRGLRKACVTSGPVVGSFKKTRLPLAAIIHRARERGLPRGNIWFVDSYMRTGTRCGDSGNSAEQFWTEIGWRSRNLSLRRDLWAQQSAISKECIQDYGELSPKDVETYRYYHPADLDSIVFQMENESDNEL